jgi:tetratricopeptide (TPR) repeat protein
VDDGKGRVRSPDEGDVSLSSEPVEKKSFHGEPVALRAHNGVRLPLRTMEVRGEIEGPLAFTEMHLEFANPEPKTLEGNLEIVLPARARPARFAYEFDGVWHEAQVVARDGVAPREGLRARTPAAIDDGRDGQLFRVSLSSIPPRARVRAVMSYRARLDDAGEPYRLHLEGLPEMESFKARIRGSAGADLDEAPVEGRVGQDGVEIMRRNWRPREDLVLRTRGRRVMGVESSGLIAARVRPLTHDHQAPLQNITVLFDTSASRAPRFEQSVERLRGLLAEMSRWTSVGFRVHLVAFDQSYETIYEGPLDELSEEHFSRLASREALGASDLGSVVRRIARRSGPPVDRVLVVTDGVVTAGTRDLDRLGDAVEELKKRGVLRVDVLGDGGLRDNSTLHRITHVLPHPGAVLDPRDSDRALVRRIIRGVVTGVELEVPGALWTFPSRLDGIQAGDEVVVFAEFGEDKAQGEIEVKVRGRFDTTHRVPLRQSSRALLETSLAEARVEDLSEALLDSADQPTRVRSKVYEQLLNLSLRHRLLNDFTRFATDRATQGTGAEVLVMGPRHTQSRRVLPNPEVASLAEGDAEADEPELSAVAVAGDSPLHFAPRYLTVDRLALVLALDERSRRGSPSATIDQGDRKPTEAPGASASEVVVPQGDEAESDATPASAKLHPVERAESLVAEMHHKVQREPVAHAPVAPYTVRRPRDTWARGRRAHSGAPARDPSHSQEGNLLAVGNLLAWGEVDQARRYAKAWRRRDPGDPLALVALGEAYEADSRNELATRAYGSLIDLYPNRPDVRRFAGTRLEGLGERADALAIDTYRRALDQHGSSPASYRMLAWALLRGERYSRAFELFEEALAQTHSPARYGKIDSLLREEIGLVAAVWLAHEPARRLELLSRLEAVGARLPTGPNLRVALTWETLDSDADLHIRDGAGQHAYHVSPQLGSGGNIVEDVTTGLGVELFRHLGAATAYPYDLQVAYYSRGPLGYGMGRVEIVAYDGKGGLRFALRPFVTNRDRAYVDLGVLAGPVSATQLVGDEARRKP